MKFKHLILSLVSLCVMTFCFAVFAQDTNAPAGLPALPHDLPSFWKYGVAAVTPVLVWAIHSIVPKIPTVLLPSITPAIGLGLGYAINALAGANLGWVDMAEAGALAVFVREVVNQAITKRLEAAAEQ